MSKSRHHGAAQHPKKSSQTSDMHTSQTSDMHLADPSARPSTAGLNYPPGLPHTNSRHHHHKQPTSRQHRQPPLRMQSAVPYRLYPVLEQLMRLSHRDQLAWYHRRWARRQHQSKERQAQLHKSRSRSRSAASQDHQAQLAGPTTEGSPGSPSHHSKPSHKLKSATLASLKLDIRHFPASEEEGGVVSAGKPGAKQASTSTPADTDMHAAKHHVPQSHGLQPLQQQQQQPPRAAQCAQSDSDVIIISDDDSGDDKSPAATFFSPVPHKHQAGHRTPTSATTASKAPQTALEATASTRAPWQPPAVPLLASSHQRRPTALLVAQGGGPAMVKVQRLLSNPPGPDQLLAVHKRKWVTMEVHQRDMQRLLGNKWLNDEIINFYMMLLQERNSRHLASQSTTKQKNSEDEPSSPTCDVFMATSMPECTPQPKQQLPGSSKADTLQGHTNSASTRTTTSAASPTAAAQTEGQKKKQQQQQSQVQQHAQQQHQRNHNEQSHKQQQQQQLVPSIYAFNSFFYSKLSAEGRGYDYKAVARWTNPKRTFTSECVLQRDLLLVPINHGNTHWALAAVWPQRGLLQYCDSFHGSGTAVLERLEKWLLQDAAAKGVTLPHTVLRRESVRAGLPSQLDGSSCGVFLCTFAELLARGVEPPFNFTQADMGSVRRGMAAQILGVQLQ